MLFPWRYIHFLKCLTPDALFLKKNLFVTILKSDGISQKNNFFILKSDAISLKIHSFSKKSQTCSDLSEGKNHFVKFLESIIYLKMYFVKILKSHAISPKRNIDSKIWCHFFEDIFILYKFSYLMFSEEKCINFKIWYLFPQDLFILYKSSHLILSEEEFINFKIWYPFPEDIFIL